MPETKPGISPCRCVRWDHVMSKLAVDDEAPPDPFCPKHGDATVVLSEEDCDCIKEEGEIVVVNPYCPLHEVITEPV